VIPRDPDPAVQLQVFDGVLEMLAIKSPPPTNETTSIFPVLGNAIGNGFAELFGICWSCVCTILIACVGAVPPIPLLKETAQPVYGPDVPVRIVGFSAVVEE